MISLQNVSKIYRMGDEDIFALDGMNLNIARGEFAAVEGPSGSGKSTLLNIIGGLDRPSQGDVFVDGKHLNNLPDASLSLYRNKNVGFIFQTFNLDPSLSAQDNVALPLLFSGIGKRERVRVACDLLSWLGLGERLKHRPSELSGGQRQKVAIARALSNRPQIVLADEPTGNLDSKSGAQVLDILGEINKRLGVTLILVTHDFKAAEKASHFYKMRDGRIID